MFDRLFPLDSGMMMKTNTVEKAVMQEKVLVKTNLVLGKEFELTNLTRVFHEPVNPAGHRV